MDTLFQILTLAWTLEGGVLPSVPVYDSVEAVFNVGPVYYVEYGFEFTYPIFSGNKSDTNGIYIGTTLRNEFKNVPNAFQMAPLQDTYAFTGGVRWNELTVGAEHVCTHSVGVVMGGDVLTQRLFGSMDRIFVRLTGKI